MFGVQWCASGPMDCRSRFIEDKPDVPEPIVYDDQNNEEVVIDLKPISEKKYLPGVKLLKKLKKAKKAKWFKERPHNVKMISDKKIAESMARIIKSF